MSHHNSIQGNQPTKISFSNSPKMDQMPTNIPVDPSSNQLIIKGQGCIVFKITNENTAEERVQFFTPENDIVTLTINKSGAIFTFQKKDSDKEESFTVLNKGKEIIVPNDGYTSGLDMNPDCVYWVSIDSLNKRLRYGKGEMRLSTALLDYEYDKAKTLFNKKSIKEYCFIDRLKNFTVSEGIELSTLWKDPVVSEPPVLVVDSKNFTMDRAAEGKITTASSLSKECQILYGNVADFQLNTPDFPDFAQAIEYSLRTPGHIGYRILEEKLTKGEFHPKEGYPYKEVYLRITLGNSQGESPGIPYVMEIWPVGCASPVHHHGFTHAIIKVLHGAIDVDVYRMLPSEHSSDKPLETVKFDKDDVTYLMPEINQFHLLKNDLENIDTCITIQCYSYSQNDNVHYATFDYVEDNELDHFDPISDYDYVDFKKEVWKEWQTYLSQKHWMVDKK